MEVKLLPFTYNVPFFSIFLALLSAVSVPFLKNGEQALRMIRVVQAVVAALSAALLAHLWSGDSFTFMMGHFPAPWGNELRAGPLGGIAGPLAFSLVMFLSLTGGAEDIRRDIREERQGQYCLLMQLLYAALLAMVYTNDLFTAYVFVEIAAVTACIAVVAKGERPLCGGGHPVSGVQLPGFRLDPAGHFHAV